MFNKLLHPRGLAAGDAHDQPQFLEVREAHLQLFSDLLHRAHDHPAVPGVAAVYTDDVVFPVHPPHRGRSSVRWQFLSGGKHRRLSEGTDRGQKRGNKRVLKVLALR